MGEANRRRKARRAAKLRELRAALEDVGNEIHYAELSLSSLQQRRARLRYELETLETQT